ncbi:MAG: GTPase ObgE, partial [Gammaproteobacteria bacterium]|nr:GTPase ObgE [Gammaproteobacteria bacterium]
AERERWLVLNKQDLMLADEAEQRCREIVDGLKWQGPVFRISALSNDGTKELASATVNYVEDLTKADEAGS